MVSYLEEYDAWCHALKNAKYNLTHDIIRLRISGLVSYHTENDLWSHTINKIGNGIIRLLIRGTLSYSK